MLKLHQYVNESSSYFTGDTDATGQVKEAVYLKYTQSDIFSLVLLVYDTSDSKYYLKLARMNSLGTASVTDFDISKCWIGCLILLEVCFFFLYIFYGSRKVRCVYL